MRKNPVQERSQQVVEDLLEATGQVIVEHGVEHLTTIRVASRAGVSIGSLYQYFENKESLLSALIDRLTRELSEMVNRSVPPLLCADIKTIVRGLLLVAFDFINQKEGLYLELLRNWYRLDIAPSLRRFEKNMSEVMRAYLTTHAADLHIDNALSKSFVIINSVVFTLLRYLSLPSAPLFDRNQLIEELTLMITAYLSSGPAPKQRRKIAATKARRRRRTAS